jgi:hypothetical protein
MNSSAPARESYGAKLKGAVPLASAETRKTCTARPKRTVNYRDAALEWFRCGTMPAWAKAKRDTLESYRVT